MTLGAMAYLKPPWFTRTIFNKIATATGVGGSETMTVTKRVSRQPQKIPVVMVGDEHYVASELAVAHRAPVIAV